MPKPSVFVVSAAKSLLKEKRFLLTAVGVFAVFTLFTAPSFSMIAFTREGGFIQQAFAQEEVTEDGTTLEVEPTEEPPPPPPPTEEPPEPDVQEAVPEEGETAAPPTTGVEPLTASFSIDSTNGDTAPNATFLFEADAQGGTGPYIYSWDLGDGSQQGSGISIHHTFEQAGTYDVTLTVTDSTGQTAPVTRQVNVRPTTDQIALPSTNATTLPSMNQTAVNETLPDFIPAQTKPQYCDISPDGRNLFVHSKNQGAGPASYFAHTALVNFEGGVDTVFAFTFTSEFTRVEPGQIVRIDVPIPSAYFNRDFSFEIVVDPPRPGWPLGIQFESDEENNTANGRCMTRPTGAPAPAPTPPEICGNGLDDDRDGQIDEEPCEGGVEICLNGLDDDRDGQIDEEPCEALPPTGEGGVEICLNGLDDDRDGQIDEEPCELRPIWGEICFNDLDDNGDGFIDERPCINIEREPGQP